VRQNTLEYATSLPDRIINLGAILSPFPDLTPGQILSLKFQKFPGATLPGDPSRIYPTTLARADAVAHCFAQNVFPAHKYSIMNKCVPCLKYSKSVISCVFFYLNQSHIESYTRKWLTVVLTDSKMFLCVCVRARKRISLSSEWTAAGRVLSLCY